MRVQDKYLMSHVKTMWRCHNITELCPGLQREQHLTVNTTHNCFHYRSFTWGNNSTSKIIAQEEEENIYKVTGFLSLHEMSIVNRSQVWDITKRNCVSWHTVTISPHYSIDIWTGHKAYNILQVIYYQHWTCYYTVGWKIASMYF